MHTNIIAPIDEHGHTVRDRSSANLSKKALAADYSETEIVQDG
jgi:hypothetical protein